MRVALVSEGTYPFAVGGVSMWCDQLIRGLPEHEWEMVALTVDGSERPRWDAPDNLARLSTIPLWGERPDRRGARRPGRRFREGFVALLGAILRPDDPEPGRKEFSRTRFLHALRLLHEYAADGGDLTDALNSNTAFSMTLDAWGGLRPDEPEITLADCVTALALIEHMLRPLSVEPVRADLVHSSMNGLCMLVGMTAKWRYDTPVVMSEHGMYLRERYLDLLGSDDSYPVKVLVLGFHRQLARAAYLVVDALAPHGGYNRRWQLRNGADPERTWTVYNGVDPDEFPAPKAEPTEPALVYLGRIDPIKDLHTLIRAFAVVRAEVPGARLRIFGDAPAGNADYRDSCQKLIADLGLTGDAVLEGRVHSSVDAYHQGQVVALTSISEGFPYAVVEAMACGRPVVCTNVGGVAEAVGDAGYVVPPRDSAAVAAACVRLLRDASLRARLGAAARDRVLAHFTLDQSIDAYRRIYRNLVDESAAAFRPSGPVAAV
ncbi:GT4 family glycosyltransferase PelF [Micromonospora sp. CPCC 205711]|uniref:GT4 family glycosyltransferase PelF n=1 Tax=Micromonospora sp. CPCC 205547 TaxID=3122400 RepID=UPI002FF00AC6